MRKFIKFISSFLIVLIFLLVGAITVPKLIGFQPLTVLSGSMEPQYHVGSLVYVKNTDTNAINIGDPITFKISEQTMVTHRVVDKNDEEQTFRTKGDANSVEDNFSVSYSNVVGKVMFNIPYLGYVATFLSTRAGFILIITTIVVLLILSFVPDTIRNIEKREEYDNENNKIE